MIGINIWRHMAKAQQVSGMLKGFITGIGINNLSNNGFLEAEVKMVIEGRDSNQVFKEIKEAVDPGDVIVKCRHCGQYGAVKCPCPMCGAPIDPEDNK
jgi:hypothetical protein